MSKSPAAGSRSERKLLAPLTSLRFFAAAIVIFHHCGRSAFEASPDWFRCFIQNGYQAVSFFFVLSGFILVYTYHQPDRPSGLKGTATAFWIARFARIYPSYALALCIALPAFLYYTFVKQTTSLVLFTSGLVCVPVLLQAWIPPIAGAWNGPAWSLSVEACFYATFPRLAPGLAGRSPRLWFWSSLCLVVTVQLVRHFIFPLPESGARPYEPTFQHNFFAYFPLFHVPTFLFGMALGKLYLARSAEPLIRFQSVLQLVSLGLLLFLFTRHGRIAPLLLSDTVMVPLFGALIFSSAAAGSALNRALSHPWLVELGEASYGMYILHSATTIISRQ